MTKGNERTEITLDTVARLSNYLDKHALAHIGKHYTIEDDPAALKRLLEAVLTPPEEPDIPVSEGMACAGAQALTETMAKGFAFPRQDAEKIYRAMECKRKEEGGVGYFRSVGQHGHIRGGDQTLRMHRRKDDP